MDASQLMDFGTASMTAGQMGQELPVVSPHLTSSVVVESEPGTSDMSPMVISAAPPPDVAAPIFTDDTPVRSAGHRVILTCMTNYEQRCEMKWLFVAEKF